MTILSFLYCGEFLKTSILVLQRVCEKGQSVIGLISTISGYYHHKIKIGNLCFRNFLRSPQRVHQFQLADAEALKKKKNHIIVVFKEKLTANELTPKIYTYKTMGLCIECFDNFEEAAAKIRYNSYIW